MLRLLWSIVLGLALLAGCGGGSDGPDPPGIAAALVVVEGDAQAATVGSTLPNTLAVRVVDAAGRGVPGSTVRFGVTAGDGALFVDLATSGPDGIARTFWTLGARAGVQRVEATIDLADGRTAVAEFSADARVGPVAWLVVMQGYAQQALPGSRLPLDWVIEARDARNNPLPGIGIEASTSSGGVVLPPAAVTGSDGRAAFAWTLGPTLGVQSLDLRSGSVAIDVQASAVQVLPTIPPAIELTSNQPAVAVQHEPPYAWFRAVLSPRRAGVVVEFGPGEGSPAFGPLRATTDASGVAVYFGAIHVAGRVSIVARAGTAVSAPIVSDVAPSPHRYDGYYQCSGPGIPTERVVIRQGVVTVDTMPDFTQASGTLDESSGQVDLQLTYRPGFVYAIHGTIVLDALQNASAALPYRLTYKDPTVEPEQNTWNCTRN